MDKVLRRWRILSLILGFALFLWFPVEDQNASLVTIFAIAICSLAIMRILLQLKIKNIPKRWFIFPLSGVLAGPGITLISLLLMAFKSGLHGHGFPDFTPGQVILTLRLTPVWTTAGLLIGLGIGIWSQTSPR